MKEPAPIKINCEGLSTKYINQLADDLNMMFEDVEIKGEYIIASKPFPFCNRYLENTVQLCEQYGVWCEEIKS